MLDKISEISNSFCTKRSETAGNWKMRITFLAPAPDMSGGARVIHIYASLLQARGHEVSVVLRPPRPLSLRERLRALFRGLATRQVSGSPTHYRNDEYALTVLDRYRPITATDVPDADIIIATWWETAEWIMAMPANKGAKAHFVQHYEAFDAMIRERVDAVLSAPTAKITISKWLDELLRTTFHNRLVTRIPNSVDMEQFDAPVRVRQPRPTVGMLYSTIAWKDCATGFAAFTLLQQQFPDAQLVTFGNSAPTADLPLPAGSRHTVLPKQSEIRHLYASCDVWMCPSKSEGFHLPPLEAMACRCPVVSTPVGGPADIIEPGVNGHLVPIGDATRMSERLAEVLSVPLQEWQRMSQAAHDTATHYSWEDATDLFERSLHNIVADNITFVNDIDR